MDRSERLAEPLRIGSIEVPNRVFLAPMSGVSDEPLRRRALEAGAGLVVTEMIASGELARERSESIARLRRPDVPVHVVQLAGRAAEPMAEATRIAEGEGADLIDINMGCPAKKVTGGYSGSALMREPDHALRMVEAVVAAATVPVTLKMRLGWDHGALNAPEIARRAEAAGVQLITVHGRTRCQFYAGRADWAAVAEVKAAVSVPLVVNGDVGSLAEACRALQLSGADAVMVGRAAYGQPWLPGAIAAEAAGRSVGGAPAPGAVADYVADHYDDMLAFYGRERGLRHARKHLGWYLDRHAPATCGDERARILTSTDPAAVLAAVRRAFAAAEAAPARRAA